MEKHIQGALFAEVPARARPARNTWLTPFADDYAKAIGGTFPFGIAAKALRPLIATHGADMVRLHFRTYLVLHRGPRAMYLSLPKFAQTFAQWDPALQQSSQTGHEMGLARGYEARQYARRDDCRPSEDAGGPARRQLVGPEVEPGEV